MSVKYEVHVQHTKQLLEDIDRIIQDFTTLVNDIQRTPVPPDSFSPVSQVVKQATDQLHSGLVTALFQGIKGVMDIRKAVEHAVEAFSKGNENADHAFVSVHARLDRPA
jgi:hypothetical protein